MPKRKWRVVFSAMKDKPIAEMLRILKPQTTKFYLTPLRFPKGVSMTELRETAKSLDANHLTFGTVPEALEAARRDAAPGELVLATGSFYLVGEVMRHLHRLDPPPSDGLLDWKL
jgi:dihydrofolate synthase/folylpolyglutamate synthase